MPLSRLTSIFGLLILPVHLSLGCSASPADPPPNGAFPTGTGGGPTATAGACSPENVTAPRTCGTTSGSQTCTQGAWSTCDCAPAGVAASADGGAIVGPGGTLSFPGNDRSDIHFQWQSTTPAPLDGTGSEGARGFLSELAFQGGTARTPTCMHGNDAGDCHFDLTQGDFAQVLQDTLGKIGGKALGCEFQAPSNGRGLVNVQVSQKGGAPACLPQLTGACDGTDSGWQFAKNAAGAPDETRVELCGTACEQATADPSTVVDVILGCGAIIR
ncbi:MAG TPA: hypothetical protein VH062_32305 [Polyangiaceae bacterium]|jgi:hypothetical protein|nr:hypothetical protein [Polyangiaceae bacterium]